VQADSSKNSIWATILGYSLWGGIVLSILVGGGILAAGVSWVVAIQWATITLNLAGLLQNIHTRAFLHPEVVEAEVSMRMATWTPPDHLAFPQFGTVAGPQLVTIPPEKLGGSIYMPLIVTGGATDQVQWMKLEVETPYLEWDYHGGGEFITHEQALEGWGDHPSFVEMAPKKKTVRSIDDV
jgi:hypothetical protein